MKTPARLYLVPFGTAHFTVPLGRQQTVDRLSTYVIERWSSPHLAWFSQGFTGRISQDEFKLWRTVWGRNTLLPILYGKFSGDNSETHIKIVISLNPVTMVVGGFLLFFIATSFANAPWQLLFVSPIVYFAVCVAFSLEANRALRLLAHIFDAHALWVENQKTQSVVTPPGSWRDLL
jgi:hypothetical protein